MENEVSTNFFKVKEEGDISNKQTDSFNYTFNENTNEHSEQSKMHPHPLISNDIVTGKDFTKDPYTYINEVADAQEEHLLFVIHGIGQDPRKLRSTLTKIKNTMISINNKKSNVFKKQIHVRIIDWKTLLLEKDKDLMKNLVDRNNNTKYPKMLIQQTPMDILHYLYSRGKYLIINDVINQMNDYYDCLMKHRPLFKGNVSVAGHSLGSVIMYDIFTNMTKTEVKEEERIELMRRKTFYECKQIDVNINEDKKLIKLDRKNRRDNFKTLGDINKISIDINIDCIKIETNADSKSSKSKENEFLNLEKEEKIYSKNKLIIALDFPIDHFFLLGSPLSLLLTVEHGAYSYLQEMEIVKDFHNIIHPMDPVAYRIEPIIINYPETKHSFTLPNWENDGLRHILLNKLIKVFCCESNSEQVDIYDKKINRKRYDFMVQESFTEKAVTMVGFLYSHMAYWNNPDVFYFIVKMIHWQGYTHAHHRMSKNYYNSNSNK